jgi:hypothetical protein
MQKLLLAANSRSLLAMCPPLESSEPEHFMMQRVGLNPVNFARLFGL